MSQITYQAEPEGILNLDNRTACTGWTEDAAARSFAAGKAAIRVNGVWFAPMPASSGEHLYSAATYLLKPDGQDDAATNTSRILMTFEKAEEAVEAQND